MAMVPRPRHSKPLPRPYPSWPVWGPAFRQMSGVNAGEVQMRIANLNRYLESLRAKLRPWGGAGKQARIIAPVCMVVYPS